MSTQDANSIRITHTYEQNNVRLLELSPEILDEISSDKSRPLYLKSLPPRPPPPPDAPKKWGLSTVEPEYVNLCTEKKSYLLRQVQSSNSIIVIKPTLAKVENGDANGDREENSGDPGFMDTMTTVTQCWSTLELEKYEGWPPSAVPFLEKSLPVYDRSGDEKDKMDVDEDTTPTTTGGSKESAKQTVLNDVPLSSAECERGWVELCAFVHTDGKKSSCWRPSVNAKLELWKKILEGSVIQGIVLDQQFLVRDLWKAAIDDDEGDSPLDKGLFEAVVRRLVDQTTLNTGKAELKWANLDKDVTVRWVAETYIEATAPTTGGAIPRSQFLSNWKDLLPEAWRSYVSWTNLDGGHFEYPDAKTVCFSEKSIEQKRVEDSLRKPNERNWHERFRQIDS